MKAAYQTVTMEGTPKEIHELMKLLDERVKKPWYWETHPYVPGTTNPYPWYPPYTTTGKPPTVTTWDNGSGITFAAPETNKTTPIITFTR